MSNDEKPEDTGVGTEKYAQSDYPIHDLVKRRWSPHIFSAQPVDSSLLLSLFEAVRWAPSGRNDQPWSFLVGTSGSSTFETICSCLSENNKAWSQNVPVLGLVVTRLFFTGQKGPNRLAYYDAGLAMGQLTLQAVDLQLSIRHIGGFDPVQAAERFSIPPGHDPVAAFAVGYRGDHVQGNPKQQERHLQPRTRKPQSCFVFEGQWGEQWEA